MKSTLKDLVDHTAALGCVDLLKVTGTAKETRINAVADDKTVIIGAVLNTAIPEFEGVFGMPNLLKLKTILGFEDYGNDATVSLTREVKEGVDTPSSIHFETKSHDFINDYRLMSKAIVEDKVKNVAFAGTVWKVEFEPTVAGIMRLKRQAQANSEEATFTAKVDAGDLKIYFGDPSTHSGNFVFQHGVVGTLGRAWKWPVKVFLSIMDLVGDKTVKFSDQGVAEIIVDSGVAVYTYWLPAHTK